MSPEAEHRFLDLLRLGTRTLRASRVPPRLTRGPRA